MNDHFIGRLHQRRQQDHFFSCMLRLPYRFSAIQCLSLLCACWLWLLCPTSGLCTDLFPRITNIKGLDSFSHLPADQIFSYVQTIRKQTEKGKYYPEAEVIHPDQEAVIPKDMASPHIVWKDTFLRSNSWLVSLTLPDGSGFHRLTTHSIWVPEADVWSQVQKASGGMSIIIEITGVDRQDGLRVVTYTRRRVHISEDRFDARIVFKNAPLPFLKSKQHPELSQWLIGDVAAYGPPMVVLEGLNSCAHCHRFSANGKSFGIDFDRDGDKGGYLVADIESNMALTESDYFTWNEFSGLGTDSMGLLFAMFNQVMFSQLFFPIAGKIAVYDRQNGDASRLPGADLDDKVQTCPEFSPDEKRLVFARAPKDHDLLGVMNGKKFLKPSPGETIKDLNAKYRIRFDLYVQPFNRGKGGKARPLKGASKNGKSNYFPRYSPDGKWIIFCQSDTGLVLQPDSTLYSVPAMGGQAKRLRCNSGRMNSWHSFTPNGHWLVFASKAVTPFTEVLIAHFNTDVVLSLLFIFSEVDSAKDHIQFNSKIR